MARKIRAESNVVNMDKKRARAKAEAHFKDATDPADDAVKNGSAGRVLENLATDGDLRRFMTLITAEEADYSKAKADANALRTRAKQKLDKLYTDAADALKSRGMSERILKALFTLLKRDPEEVKAEQKASVWAMRAMQMPVGSQLAFFDEAVDDPIDAYNRAMAAGRQAYAENKSTSDNPYTGHQQLQQAWLEGYHEGQTHTIQGMGGNAPAADEAQPEGDNPVSEPDGDQPEADSQH